MSNIVTFGSLEVGETGVDICYNGTLEDYYTEVQCIELYGQKFLAWNGPGDEVEVDQVTRGYTCVRK